VRPWNAVADAFTAPRRFDRHAEFTESGPIAGNPDLADDRFPGNRREDSAIAAREPNAQSRSAALAIERRFGCYPASFGGHRFDQPD